MASSNYSKQQFQRTLKDYRLTPEDLNAEMNGSVRYRSLFDDDYSWDQMFSRHPEIDPESELNERCDDISAQAEKTGRAIARDACGNLESMMQHLTEKGESGSAYLYYLLNQYYIPELGKARETLINSCERQRRKNEERRTDLKISAEEAASASRLGGDRESRAIRYLEDADNYLSHFSKQLQNENMIRVMSTLLSYCSKSISDSGYRQDGRADPAYPVSDRPSGSREADEIRLSYPRRCTITSDDGDHYSVEISDGVSRYFSADLTLKQALSAAENLMSPQ